MLGRKNIALSLKEPGQVGPMGGILINELGGRWGQRGRAVTQTAQTGNLRLDDRLKQGPPVRYS